MTLSPRPLLEDLASIKAYIEAARAVVKDGLMPDMSQLEQRIAQLCQGIQAAEATEQSHCLPALASLLKCLDDCEQDVRAWKKANNGTPAP